MARLHLSKLHTLPTPRPSDISVLLIFRHSSTSTIFCLIWKKKTLFENNEPVFWMFEIEEMKVGVKTSSLRAEEESFLSLITCKKLFSLLV